MNVNTLPDDPVIVRLSSLITELTQDKKRLIEKLSFMIDHSKELMEKIIIHKREIQKGLVERSNLQKTITQLTDRSILLIDDLCDGMINGDEDIDDCIDVHENCSIIPGSPKQKSVGQKITPIKHQNKNGQTNQMKKKKKKIMMKQYESEKRITRSQSKCHQE